MEIINCTPHTIVVDLNGNQVSFPASGILPRIETTSTPRNPIEGIPTFSVKRGEIEDLPAPEEGKVFLVSAMVFAATTRLDVIAPDTGPTAIRENGRILAVRNLLVP